VESDRAGLVGKTKYLAMLKISTDDGVAQAAEIKKEHDKKSTYSTLVRTRDFAVS